MSQREFRRRHRSGQPVYEPKDRGPTKELLAKRAKVAGLEHVNSPHHGSEIGRMFLKEQLTEEQRAAGERYAWMLAANMSQMGAPRGPSAVDVVAMGGKSLRADDPVYEARVAAQLRCADQILQYLDSRNAHYNAVKLVANGDTASIPTVVAEAFQALHDQTDDINRAGRHAADHERDKQEQALAA